MLPVMYQAVAIENAENCAHDLGLELSPMLKAIYESPLRLTTAPSDLGASEQGAVEATVRDLSAEIRAKYSQDGQSAFQAGRDAGFLLFVNSALTGMQKEGDDYYRKHPFIDGHSLLENDGEMTGPMMEAAQRLNTQVTAWGLGIQFGNTTRTPAPQFSGGYLTITMPNGARDPEIRAFVDAIDKYLQP
jgi:hypothetical protein